LIPELAQARRLGEGFGERLKDLDILLLKPKGEGEGF